MNIWKTEYLRYKYFWGTIFCIEILLDMLRLLNMLPVVDGVDTVYSFWQMLSWIAIVALSVFDFFSFFYLNKDRMLHLLLMSKEKILYMKSVVLATYMMIYFLMGLIRYLILLPSNAVESLLRVSLIYIISKILAITSFFSVLIALLTVIKKINNKVIGAIIMAILFGGVVSLQAYGLYQLVSISHNVDWTIGIVDGAIGINHYANILPIVFTEIGNNMKYVEEGFYPVSVILNAVIAVVSFTISKILFKTQKFNYVEG